MPRKKATRARRKIKSTRIVIPIPVQLDPLFIHSAAGSVYALIHMYSQQGNGWCLLRTQDIADIVGILPSSVRRICSILMARGMIESVRRVRKPGFGGRAALRRTIPLEKVYTEKYLSCTSHKKASKMWRTWADYPLLAGPCNYDAVWSANPEKRYGEKAKRSAQTRKVAARITVFADDAYTAGEVDELLLPAVRTMPAGSLDIHIPKTSLLPFTWGEKQGYVFEGVADTRTTSPEDPPSNSSNFSDSENEPKAQTSLSCAHLPDVSSVLRLCTEVQKNPTDSSYLQYNSIPYGIESLREKNSTELRSLDPEGVQSLLAGDEWNQPRVSGKGNDVVTLRDVREGTSMPRKDPFWNIGDNTAGKVTRSELPAPATTSPVPPVSSAGSYPGNVVDKDAGTQPASNLDGLARLKLVVDDVKAASSRRCSERAEKKRMKTPKVESLRLGKKPKRGVDGSGRPWWEVIDPNKANGADAYEYFCYVQAREMKTTFLDEARLPPGKNKTNIGKLRRILKSYGWASYTGMVNVLFLDWANLRSTFDYRLPGMKYPCVDAFMMLQRDLDRMTRAATGCPNPNDPRALPPSAREGVLSVWEERALDPKELEARRVAQANHAVLHSRTTLEKIPQAIRDKLPPPTLRMVASGQNKVAFGTGPDLSSYRDPRSTSAGLLALAEPPKPVAPAKTRKTLETASIDEIARLPKSELDRAIAVVAKRRSDWEAANPGKVFGKTPESKIIKETQFKVNLARESYWSRYVHAKSLAEARARRKERAEWNAQVAADRAARESGGSST